MLVFQYVWPNTCPFNLFTLSLEIVRNGKSLQSRTLHRCMHDVMNYVRNVIFASHTFTPVVCPRHKYGQIRIAISRCAMWPLDIHRCMPISNFSQRPSSDTSNDGELLRTGTHCMKTARYRVIAISGHFNVLRTWHIWYRQVSARKVSSLDSPCQNVYIKHFFIQQMHKYIIRRYN